MPAGTVSFSVEPADFFFASALTDPVVSARSSLLAFASLDSVSAACEPLALPRPAFLTVTVAETVSPAAAEPAIWSLVTDRSGRAGAA